MRKHSCSVRVTTWSRALQLRSDFCFTRFWFRIRVGKSTPLPPFPFHSLFMEIMRVYLVSLIIFESLYRMNGDTLSKTVFKESKLMERRISKKFKISKLSFFEESSTFNFLLNIKSAVNKFV